MFTLNLPPEIIAKTCEVSVDYVLDLKKDLENNERREIIIRKDELRIIRIALILFVSIKSKIDINLFYF